MCRYEELRSAAVQGYRSQIYDRQGLTTLMTKGMARWIELWTVLDLPTPRTKKTSRITKPASSNEIVDQIVSILANIALEGATEVNA